MQHFIIVVHLMIVLAMIGFVLLQKSEGGGLGMGNSGGGFLSSRGTANVLTRATATLAAGFFATSLVLSILAGLERKPRAIITGGEPSQSTPTTPGAPPAPPAGGVLDMLRQSEQPATPPSAPAQPPAPP